MNKDDLGAVLDLNAFDNEEDNVKANNHQTSIDTILTYERCPNINHKDKLYSDSNLSSIDPNLEARDVVIFDDKDEIIKQQNIVIDNLKNSINDLSDRLRQSEKEKLEFATQAEFLLTQKRKSLVDKSTSTDPITLPTTGQYIFYP